MWQLYPQNLDLDGPLQSAFDLSDYHERLSADAERICLRDDSPSLAVQVSEMGSPAIVLLGTGELEKYLEDSRSFRGTRIFQIHQQSSIGRLSISEKGLRILLSSISAFPAILDVVHCFGRRDDHDANPVTPYQQLSRKDGQVKESSYILKFAEQHAREKEIETWSIRKMALYIQDNKQTGQRNIVAINSSLRFQRRLAEAASMGALEISDIETMSISSAFRNWQEYFSHLERRLNDVNIKANSSGFHSSHTSEKSGVQLEPKDLQSMYEIRNKLSLGRSALGASRETLTALGDNSSTPSLSQDRLNAAASEVSMDNIASMARRELNFNIERADNLMQRMDGILGLVRSIIDIQTAMAVQNSSDKANEAAAHANEMAKLAREDNTVMLQLSARASEDGHTLKVITVLTLVYLPAMFVATLMGTGYVKIGYTEAANKIEIRVSGEMIIFVVLTALLLIATLGAWAVFERKYRRNGTLRRLAVSSV